MLQDCLLPHIRKQGGKSLVLFTNSEETCRFYEKNGFRLFHTENYTYNGNTMGSWSYRMELS